MYGLKRRSDILIQIAKCLLEGDLFLCDGPFLFFQSFLSLPYLIKLLLQDLLAVVAVEDQLFVLA